MEILSATQDIFQSILAKGDICASQRSEGLGLLARLGNDIFTARLSKMGEQQEEYRCFIGNLSWSTSDRGLEKAFEKYGNVVDAKVVLDKYSGRSRGFGFVAFEDQKAMEEAIEKMNGVDLDGRSITVDKASANQGAGRDRNGDRDRDDGGGRRDRDRGSRDYGGGGGRGSGGGGRGSGGGDCYKCGKPGHFARECPSGDDSRGGGRYGGRDDRHGGGGSRHGSDRDEGDRYSGRSSRDSGSRGSDKYSRDRSGPYERPSGGSRS